jgi:uncharacterized protein YdaU (DUF1376 family)
MTDAQIDRLIDKSHLSRDKQVVEYVQEHLPDASEEQIIARNKRKRELRSSQDPKKITSHYYYPVFSNHLYGYQVDLLQRSKEVKGHNEPDEDDEATGSKQTMRDYPPFFFIAINTNTKYAYAYKLTSKSATEILRVLKLWWRDTGHKINSIRCDEEAGLDSHSVNAWFTRNKISVKSIVDQNHTSLSVVDRFIRTLRDMNTPTEKSTRTSANRKYRDFTVKRMNKLLEIYNNTKHKTTGHKPSEMQADSEDPKKAELEKKYIIKKLYESERRHKLSDYNLKIDDYVKYIVPRDGKKKHRYQITPEYYKIMKKDGHAYVLGARDGSTVTMTRWRLIPVKDTHGLKMARSVNDAKHGIMDNIMSYNKEDQTCFILWKSPNKERITTHEPLGLLKAQRERPNKLTKEEEEFWKGTKRKDIPRAIFSRR